MLVRRMTAADLTTVALIEAESFTQPWSENAFLDALKLENNILVVAEEDDTIVGYICMYVSFDEGEITNVAVSKDKRKQGIAAIMLGFLFDEAKKADVNRIVLEVRASNMPAIMLYEKMQFVKLGIRKGFYDMPKEDAIIMEYNV